MRRIVQALESGKWVATNVSLHDGWAWDVAGANVFRRMVPSRRRTMAARFERMLYMSANVEELVRLRLPPCGRCRRCTGGRPCGKESRGLLVLDEAHEWLNARTWDTDESGVGRTRAEATAARLRIVRFFARHRKYGWDVDLITQDEKRLDTQVRNNFEHHVHLKNLRRVKIPLVPIYPIPFNFFVAITTWHDSDKTRIGAETYLLSKRIAACYDSLATPADDHDIPGGTILLGGVAPLAVLPPGDGPRADAEGRKAPAPAATVTVEDLDQADELDRAADPAW